MAPCSLRAGKTLESGLDREPFEVDQPSNRERFLSERGDERPQNL